MDPIPRLCEILTNIHTGGEQQGFTEIKGIINDLPLEEELISRLRSGINVAQCAALAMPRGFHLCKSGLIFILQSLGWIGVTRFDQIKDLDPDVKALLLRLLLTVTGACYAIGLLNKRKLFGTEVWVLPVKPNRPSFTIDSGAWNDFMEFMANQTDVINPSPENCILF